MVSIKVLFAACCCLLATVSCTLPLLGHPGGHPVGHVGGGKGVGGGGLISNILGGITKIIKCPPIFDDNTHLQPPNKLGDCFNIFGDLSYAVGKILHVIVPEFEDLLSKIVLSLSRILICVLGAPGLSDKILHNKRPGSFNSRLTCDGLDHFRRGGSSPKDYDWAAIYKSVGLTGVGGQISGLLKKHKKKAQPHSVSVVFGEAFTISEIINEKPLTQNHFSKVMDSAFIMFFAISSSHQADAGTKLYDTYYPPINKILSDNQLPPLPSSKDDIINKIKGCNNDGAMWSGKGGADGDDNVTDNGNDDTGNANDNGDVSDSNNDGKDNISGDDDDKYNSRDSSGDDSGNNDGNRNDKRNKDRHGGKHRKSPKKDDNDSNSNEERPKAPKPKKGPKAPKHKPIHKKTEPPQSDKCDD